MEIDGYVPADEKVALEQGVDFVYDLGKRIGQIKIRSRILNDSNPQFVAAYRAYGEWQARQKRLARDADSDDEADRRFVGLLHDHGVIDWSTTIKSGGKPIAATRDNFVDLLTSRACRQVAVLYFQEAADEYNFRAVDSEEDEKN